MATSLRASAARRAPRSASCAPVSQGSLGASRLFRKARQCEQLLQRRNCDGRFVQLRNEATKGAVADYDVTLLVEHLSGSVSGGIEDELVDRLVDEGRRFLDQ